jgi:hypothetical protein
MVVITNAATPVADIYNSVWIDGLHAKTRMITTPKPAMGGL